MVGPFEPLLNMTLDFEPVQNENIKSPESQNLASYEEFSRQELPRIFKNSLETIVNNEMQPIEERFRGQLTNLIKDCQDQVFFRFKSLVQIPEPQAEEEESTLMTTEISAEQMNDDDFVARIYKPPPPQADLQPTIQIPNQIFQHDKSSDSGYGSNDFNPHENNPIMRPLETLSTDSQAINTQNYISSSFETEINSQPLRYTTFPENTTTDGSNELPDDRWSIDPPFDHNFLHDDLNWDGGSWEPI